MAGTLDDVRENAAKLNQCNCTQALAAPLPARLQSPSSTEGARQSARLRLGGLSPLHFPKTRVARGGTQAPALNPRHPVRWVGGGAGSPRRRPRSLVDWRPISVARRRLEFLGRQRQGESGRQRRSELMPIRLEIVTPERLAYSDDVGHGAGPRRERGAWHPAPPHAARVACSGSGSSRSGRAARRSCSAIAGGFLQVSAGQGRRHGRDRGPGLGHRPRAWPRRPGARRSGRWRPGYVEGADLSGRPRAAPGRRCCASGSPSAAAPGGPSLAGVDAHG